MKATRNQTRLETKDQQTAGKQMDTTRVGRTAHRYQRTALSPVKARFGYATADDIAAGCSIRQRETMVGEELSHWLKARFGYSAADDILTKVRKRGHRRAPAKPKMEFRRKLIRTLSQA